LMKNLSPTSILKEDFPDGTWNENEDALMLIFLRLPKCEKRRPISHPVDTIQDEAETGGEEEYGGEGDEDEEGDGGDEEQMRKFENRASELVSSVANIAKLCCVATGPSQCGIDYASLVDIATLDSARAKPW
jgi:hypothetical protein